MQNTRVALLMADLNGGGVQVMSLVVARELAARGRPVDLVVCESGGPLEDSLPEAVRRIQLAPGTALRTRLDIVRADPLGLHRTALPLVLARRPSPTLAYIGALAGYLARERPAALIAATPNNNVEAVLARRLAGTSTRLILTERTALGGKQHASRNWRHRFLPALMRHAYLQAEVRVTVSRDLGDEIAAETGIPRDKLITVYNPVVGPDVGDLAAEPVDHPWFAPGGPPVVLGAGRLTDVKDWPTLIRAFALLRGDRLARLVILGAAGEPANTPKVQAELMAVAEGTGVAADVDLPGYVANPFAYMAKAAVFASSSTREGLPGVLIQAMACGCPVVATDCVSGPREILADGRFGGLVQVGDVVGLAAAMGEALDTPPDRAKLQARAAEFSVARSIATYERLIDGPCDGAGMPAVA